MKTQENKYKEIQVVPSKETYEIRIRIDNNLKMKLDETASRLSLSRNAIVKLLIHEGLRDEDFTVSLYRNKKEM